MRNIKRYAGNNPRAVGLIAAAAVGLAFAIIASLVLGQTVTTITNPDGSVTTVTWTPPQAAAPTTGPGSTPTTSPTVSPRAAAYVAGIGEFLDGLGLPGINGRSYGSAAWLVSLLAAGHDANGFVDLTPWITAAGNAGKLAYVSPSAVAWPSLAKAALFPDFKSAEASGDTVILFLDGQSYPLAVWNQNLENSNGTAANPIIVCRIGPNGFLDHSIQQRPICQGGFGLNDCRAGHPPTSYVIIDGLDFQGANPPTQQYCLSFLDNGNGTPSGYILVEDCRFNHFITGTCLQSGSAYPLQHLVFRRCVWEHCYFAFYGEFHFHVQDFLMLDCTLANCGWDAQFAPKSDPMGRSHDSYVAVNPTTETNDPQHRVINTILATPAAEGCEGDCGGLFDTVLYLACPIAGYGGVYHTLFNNCVVDGDNQEFDSLATCGTNNGGVYTVTQIGAAGDALSLGPVGTVSRPSGYERGWGLFFDCAPTGTMENSLFLDKPDPLNAGPAIQVCLQDNPKGLPSTSSSVTFNNVKVHGWTGSPIQVNGTTSTLTAMVNYANCVLPGITGVSGVSGTEPTYLDSTRTVSTYAASIGITEGAPAWLAATENNWSGNWNPALSAGAAINWIQAGFVVKGN